MSKEKQIPTYTQSSLFVWCPLQNATIERADEEHCDEHIARCKLEKQLPLCERFDFRREAGTFDTKPLKEQNKASRIVVRVRNASLIYYSNIMQLLSSARAEFSSHQRYQSRAHFLAEIGGLSAFYLGTSVITVLHTLIYVLKRLYRLNCSYNQRKHSISGWFSCKSKHKLSYNTQRKLECHFVTA